MFAQHRGAKIVLLVAGVIALLIGAVLMFNPAGFLGQQGLTVDDHMALVAQAQGSILFGLGALNVLALRSNDARGLQAVLGGNVVTHLAGLGVNVHAYTANLVNGSIVGDVVTHVVFAMLCAFFAMRVGRAQA